MTLLSDSVLLELRLSSQQLKVERQDWNGGRAHPGKGDQDSEREPGLEERRVWKWVILSIACFVYCCVSGVRQPRHTICTVLG